MKPRHGFYEGFGLILWAALVLVIVLIVFGMMYNAKAKSLVKEAHTDDGRVDWEAGYMALSMQYFPITIDLGEGEQQYYLADLLMDTHLKDMTNDQRNHIEEEIKRRLGTMGTVWEDDEQVLTPIIVLIQDSDSICVDSYESKLCGGILQNIYDFIPGGLGANKGLVEKYTNEVGTRIHTLVLPTQPQTTITAIMQPVGGDQ